MEMTELNAKQQQNTRARVHTFWLVNEIDFSKELKRMNLKETREIFPIIAIICVEHNE